ncbi:MAG: UDP-N-acetylmuramoyl-L-alanine--D-glutamate ligase [Raoultibacter sp.]
MAASPVLIADRHYAPERLGRVLVLGLGKSGRAAACYCLDFLGDRVENLAVAAGSCNDAAQEFARDIEERGAEVLFDHYEIEGTYDLCIASPGISQFSDFYRSAVAASTEVISEVEFAWRESKASTRWVAVTGTNGKTTTTALTAHVLQACGVRALAVGNIGDTCLAAVAEDDAADVFVAEVSSYQLASTNRFAPNVAVLLNITPDHIKWHKTHEAYVAAKLKVFANLAQVDGSVCVLDATNDEVRKQVRIFRAQTAAQRGFEYLPLGCARGLDASMRDACGSDNAAYLRDGMLHVDFRDESYDVVRADALQVRGEHNASNALAAACVALSLGLEIADIRAGLESFKALEHRIEPCGSIAGVACYNDSKATNVDATLKALAAFGEVPPIVLLGGDDKGTDLTDLVVAAEAHCKAVVCFGAAAPRFFEAFEPASCPHFLAGCLESALDCALDVAIAGDVVMLSPACASFDEFTCFEQRGEAFKKLVASRAAVRGA